MCILFYNKETCQLYWAVYYFDNLILTFSAWFAKITFYLQGFMF